MSDAYRTHGAFSWNELMTTDPGKAKTFYAALLGWTLEEAPMGVTGYTLIKVGETPVGGIMGIPPQAPAGMPPNWGVYVTVDNVDESAEKAAALGGHVCVPPTDIAGVGRFCVISDPQGAVLSLITYIAKE
ncbi:MAG: VOC family protein [Desulfovibrio sp.]|nr:VOC family protein [Desulfovibrio sp.]